VSVRREMRLRFPDDSLIKTEAFRAGKPSRDNFAVTIRNNLYFDVGNAIIEVRIIAKKQQFSLAIRYCLRDNAIVSHLELV
jgi:hypothetical protein